MSDDHKKEQEDLQKPAQENTSGGSVIAAKRKARNRRAMVMKTKAKTTAPGESGTTRGVPIGSAELLDYLDENWDDFKITAEELTEEEQAELQAYFTECHEDFEEVGEALWGGQDNYNMLKSVFDSIRDDAGRDKLIEVLQEVGLI